VRVTHSTGDDATLGCLKGASAGTKTVATGGIVDERLILAAVKTFLESCEHLWNFMVPNKAFASSPLEETLAGNVDDEVVGVP
jgi:hypothetical protein